MLNKYLMNILISHQKILKYFLSRKALCAVIINWFYLKVQNFVRALDIDWQCSITWGKSSYNTFWCLLGCSIGDFGTIAIFQYFKVLWHAPLIMGIAMINGIFTSILLEGIVLSRQMSLNAAVKLAVRMSFISMISMELAMNIVDLAITGGAILTFQVIPFMLFAGFLTPLPYNYWRLKKLGIGCH